MMMLAVKVDVDVMRSANEERRSYAVKMRCEDWETINVYYTLLPNPMFVEL